MSAAATGSAATEAIVCAGVDTTRPPVRYGPYSAPRPEGNSTTAGLPNSNTWLLLLAFFWFSYVCVDQAEQHPLRCGGVPRVARPVDARLVRIFPMPSRVHSWSRT